MLKADANGHLALSGPLTSREVSAHFHDSQSWRTEGMPQVVDLGEVDKADSSALALLLEWASWAQADDRSIRFINVPRALCVLASLCQIGELLGWKTVDFNDGGERDTCCG